jgi:hypothetical protein
MRTTCIHPNSYDGTSHYRHIHCDVLRTTLSLRILFLHPLLILLVVRLLLLLVRHILYPPLACCRSAFDSPPRVVHLETLLSRGFA